MMPEIGHYLLCLGLALALLLSVYPLWGAARQDSRLTGLARPLAVSLRGGQLWRTGARLYR